MFPNAKKGVGRIFIAEILAVIGAAVAIVAGIIVIVGAIAGSAAQSEAIGVGSVATGGALALASGVVLVVAFVINLVGLINAKQDDDRFRIAFFAMLVSIITSVVASIFASSNPTLNNILETIANVFNLASTIFVILGIMSLAEKLNNPDMVKRGNTIIKLITASYVLAIVGNICAVIFRATSAVVLAGVFETVASVVSLVSYIIYLIYLASAKKMLA